MKAQVHPEIAIGEENIARIAEPSEIMFQPSLFEHRPSTVLFQTYEDTTNDLKKFVPLSVENLNTCPKLYYHCAWKRVCIDNILKQAGLKQAKKKKTKCCLYWTKHLSIREFYKLNESQKVNHFPESWCIGRKDRLIKCIEGARKFSQKKGFGTEVYNFVPQGWILPNDYITWKKVCKRKRNQTFIMKPPASSCGRGIKLVRGTKDVGQHKKCIIQRYIKSPYLIDGKKFDLRLYVLVTSFDPLRLYLFREGLVRFASSAYTRERNASRFSFLTNYSVNKKNECYKEDYANEDQNDKWSLSFLWKVLMEKVGEEKVSMCQNFIRDLIVKTVIAADYEISPGLRRTTRSPRSCFELFGFDVLLDASLKPWLLEVNISPSLMVRISTNF